jgi:hypothetical protein
LRAAIQKDTIVHNGRVLPYRKWSVFFCLVAAALAGCKRSASQQMVTVDASTVVLSGGDIAPTGALSEAGLKKLGNESAKPAITVIVARTHISDAALPQLAKYKNIQSLQAPGSQLSDAAIDKLKADVPALKTIIK